MRIAVNKQESALGWWSRASNRRAPSAGGAGHFVHQHIRCKVQSIPCSWGMQAIASPV